MIDWRVVRATARRSVGANRLASGEQLSVLRSSYRDLVEECTERIAEHTGWGFAVSPNAVEVVDRSGWVDFNVVQFEQLLDPVAESIEQAIDGDNPISRFVSSGVGLIASGQLGLILGYLSRRVLGQYDVALFGKAGDRRVYFVDPNIEATIDRLDVNPSSFRFYIALHETTHAAEFGAHPWLADHLRGLLQQLLASVTESATLATGWLGSSAFAGRGGTARLKLATGNPMEALLSPRQRLLLHRIQAAMSLIEGFGDFIMHSVAPMRIPDADLIGRRIEFRRANRGLADVLVGRLTGMDVKLAQYDLGERFCRRVVELGGSMALDAAWAGPSSLPSIDELAQPELWMDRIVAANVLRPA